MDDPALPDAIDVSDAGLYSIEWFYRNELKLSDQELIDRGVLWRREYARQAADLELIAGAADQQQIDTISRFVPRGASGRASLAL